MGLAIIYDYAIIENKFRNQNSVGVSLKEN